MKRCHFQMLVFEGYEGCDAVFRAVANVASGPLFEQVNHQFLLERCLEVDCNGNKERLEMAK